MREKDMIVAHAFSTTRCVSYAIHGRNLFGHAVVGIFSFQFIGAAAVPSSLASLKQVQGEVQLGILPITSPSILLALNS